MGNKQVKSVSQLASLCSDSLATLKKDKNDKAVHSDENEEHCKIINGTVQAMKNVILGKPISQLKKKEDEKGEKLSPEQRKKLAAEFIQKELTMALIKSLKVLSVDCKRNVVLICSHLSKEDGDYRDHITQNPDILEFLVSAYNDHDYTSETGISLYTGDILQAFIRNIGDRVASVILMTDDSNWLWAFFSTHVDITSFDVQTQAFNTLKDLFLSQSNNKICVRDPAVKLIAAKEDQFFDNFNVMLKSSTFVTCRQSLRLLHQILFDPQKKTYKSMMRYITNKKYLKITMNLLRDASDQIQFEAFHLFKVFVLNPKRSPEVTRVLSKRQNKKALVEFLTTFKTKFKEMHFQEPGSDDLFQQELANVIATISQLEPSDKKPAEVIVGQSSEELGAFGEKIK